MPPPDTLTPTAEPGLQADQRLVDRGWLRIGAGAAIAAQAMVFSLAVNLSEVHGLVYWVVHGLLIGSALGALVFLGGDLVRSALESVSNRRVSIDLLFLLTLLGALAGSLTSTFLHAGSVYYEVVAILIVVHTLGRMLAARSRVAALSAARATRQEFDACDVITAGGAIVHLPVAEVRSGDQVRIAPGAAISIDGVIVSGRGFVQETSMTGEWRPVSRGPGDPVLAGTYTIDGALDVRAQGGPRKLDQILAVVEHARLAPSRLQAQADRLISWFLPVVALTSITTFGVWFWFVPWERALFNAMAVLLVACPCAMGLATPVAVWGGLARLARLGLVARTGDVLDVLGRTDMVCIDKTGTLSENALSVRGWRNASGLSGREQWLKSAVVALEEGVRHPVAEALRHSFNAGESVNVRERKLQPGQGIVGIVEFPGSAPQAIAVGEPSLGRVVPNPASTTAGKNVFVYLDGELAATVEFEERWRAGMAEAFSELKQLGIEFEVLSGDPGAVAALGGQAPVKAGLSPEDKRQRVHELVSQGRIVLLTGDGINDAAAMAEAHGAIAMQSGADLTRAAAMAVFVGEDLRFLPHAIRVARAARKAIGRNLLFAAAYNTVGMVLAASGQLHPVAAALLMVGSSIFVSVSALRAVERKETPDFSSAGKTRGQG